MHPTTSEVSIRRLNSHLLLSNTRKGTLMAATLRLRTHSNNPTLMRVRWYSLVDHKILWILDIQGQDR